MKFSFLQPTRPQSWVRLWLPSWTRGWAGGQEGAQSDCPPPDTSTRREINTAFD